MLSTLALLAITFAPTVDSVPNRQPQLAAHGNLVALTYGAGDSIYFSLSRSSGATWSKPTVVANKGKLALGARRGPRIVITRNATVITAIVGEIGRGKDENLAVWRSVDQGNTWSEQRVLNDVRGAAREGLHAMASDGESTIFVAWLDLRNKVTQIYGVVSRDGGKSWSDNRLIYRSPSGSVCECCHPSVYVERDGKIWVMFRNSLDGNRDMYVAASEDHGETFSAARKLGSGSWKLEGCPMDGGSIAVSGNQVATVWRRENTVYHSGLRGSEVELGPGRQPTVALTTNGPVYAWTDGKSLLWQRGDEQKTRKHDGQGSYLSLVALSDGNALVASERDGRIVIDSLR